MKRVFQLFTVFAISLVVLSLAYSCTEDDESVDASSFTITLSPSEVRLAVGETEQIVATSEDYNGSIADLLTYSVASVSTNPDAITVSSTGLVTAVEIGEAVVVATSTDGSFSQIVPVYVEAEKIRVESVTITDEDGVELEESMSLNLNLETYQFDVTIDPDLYTTTNTVAWSIDGGDDVIYSTIDSDSGLLTFGSVEESFDVVASIEDSVDGAILTDTITITVEKDSITFTSTEHTYTYSGENKTLQVELVSDDFTASDIEWSSSKIDVVTVSGDGSTTGTLTMTGAGEAVITAKVSDVVFATYTVTVNYAVATSVTINEKNLTSDTIDAGETQQFTAAVETQYADKSVVWSLTDTENTGSNITADGLFTAGSTTGFVTVIATQGSQSDSYTFNVNVPVTNVSLNYTSYSLVGGTFVTLVATITPSTATTTTVDWAVTEDTSDVIEIAVNQDGTLKVTANSGVTGTATITVTSVSDSSVKVSCTITVTDSAVLVTDVNITSPSSDNVEYVYGVDSSETFSATALGASGAIPTVQGVTWSSSDPSVASVDSASGVVTFKSVGTATITATSNDEAKRTDSVTIYVCGIQGIADVEILIGDSCTLSGAYLYRDGAQGEVTYAITSGTSATMDASGVVTTLALGESVVTVTSVDSVNGNQISDTFIIKVVGDDTGIVTPDYELGGGVL